MRRPKDKVVVFQDGVGAYRWERIAPDGAVLAVSGFGFDSLSECEHQARTCNARPYTVELAPGTETVPALHETTDTVIFDRQAPEE